MSDGICAVAADTKLETPEGPLTMRTIAKTPCSVLTRTVDGRTRFHMVVRPEQLEAPRPVVRVQLDNGLALRVGADQILFQDGMREVRAGDLKAGDRLLGVFAFPEGYSYRADDGAEQTSSGTLTVASVAPAGEADVFRFQVNVTGRFAFSAGVLGKADPA